MKPRSELWGVDAGQGLKRSTITHGVRRCMPIQEMIPLSFSSATTNKPYVFMSDSIAFADTQKYAHLQYHD
jgi:hypothetical protein